MKMKLIIGGVLVTLLLVIVIWVASGSSSSEEAMNEPVAEGADGEETTVASTPAVTLSSHQTTLNIV